MIAWSILMQFSMLTHNVCLTTSNMCNVYICVYFGRKRKRMFCLYYLLAASLDMAGIYLNNSINVTRSLGFRNSHSLLMFCKALATILLFEHHTQLFRTVLGLFVEYIRCVIATCIELPIEIGVKTKLRSKFSRKNFSYQHKNGQSLEQLIYLL